MISKYNEFNIHKICKQYGIENYTINNGLLDVNGSVHLVNKKLTRLPLDFGNVTGSFLCSYNKLSSLEGAPKQVGGSFYCNNNQLNSLQGAPSYVGRDFDCSNNQLITLEGAPIEVGGDFSCQHNQLDSLEGAPKQVGGDFDCHNNQLNSLQGAPKKVGGDFDCHNNQLTSLQGAPIEVGGGFYCYDNQLAILQGAPKEVGGGFYCGNNSLPKEILKFKDIKYIFKWQDEYNIWRRDGSLDLFRFNELIKDYQKDLIKENNTKKYYYKITPEDYPEQLININPKAIEIIKSHFKKYKYLNIKIEYSCDTEFISINSYDKCIMTVIEVPDEWFIIATADFTYYKCDQLEGLKKFLLHNYK